MFRAHNHRESENGSGIVGFVLVAPLIVAVFIAIGQIAMLVADKSVLDSAAAIGARTAAAADSSNLNGKNAAFAVMASRTSGFKPESIAITRERASGITYVKVTIIHKVEIPYLDQDLIITARSRAVDEGSL